MRPAILLDDKPKHPATGAYRCRDCGAEVTADDFHPAEACAVVNALRLMVTVPIQEAADD